MIQVKPVIAHEADCPSCGVRLYPERVLWQGIHVCAVSVCPGCGAEIVDDLPVGHAEIHPCRVNLTSGDLFIDHPASRRWFGLPFLESLRNPREDAGITLTVERFRVCRDVVILNCLDFLYGHALLKLLNAQARLERSPELGLVVLIPPVLRWMVPDGVAEVWTTTIVPARARQFHPELDRRIAEECGRFDRIFLDRAHSHPKHLDIERFTGVARHRFDENPVRVTFVWREDRPWLDGQFLPRIVARSGIAGPFIVLQNLRVRRLFSLMRRRLPGAVFTVAGLGTATGFPSWVDDRRIPRFTDDAERELCRIYAESRLVVGVHGSNMLLPSAHAGLTLDLMPVRRWGNMAQDILYQEEDSRMSSYRYRYVPMGVGMRSLAHIATLMVTKYEGFRKWMEEIYRP